MHKDYSVKHSVGGAEAFDMRGEFVEASRKWNWGVTVTDTTVTLYGNKCGTTIVIR